MKNSGPNFIVPGFPKCGTTWLYDRLNELPQFEMPYQKEVHYFDANPKYASVSYMSETFLQRIKRFRWWQLAFGRPVSQLVKGNLRAFKFFILWYWYDYNDSWYLRLFNKRKGLSGDITPTYCLVSEGELSRMSKITQNAKIIFVLRDPIERAWSQFRMRARNAKKDIDDYSREEILSFLDSDGEFKRTNYLDVINRFEKYYNKNNISYHFYDQLEKEPVQFLNKIIKLLGGGDVDVEKYCKINSKSNVSKIIELPDFVKEFLLAKYGHILMEMSEKFGGYCTNWLEKYKLNEKEEG